MVGKDLYTKDTINLKKLNLFIYNVNIIFYTLYPNTEISNYCQHDHLDNIFKIFFKEEIVDNDLKVSNK